MDIKELQSCILDILVYFDELCRKHNLKYIISSGTCLGAVRHKGFIPWDNDADVIMDRESYDKLYEIMKNEKGRYQLFSYRNKEDYNYPFDKIIDTDTILIEKKFKPISNLGVYVDIFPIDYVPNEKKKRDRLIRRLKIMKKRLTFKIGRSNKFWKSIIKWFLTIGINPKKYCKKINDICQKCNNKKSNYLMDIVWGSKYIDAKIYDELIEVPFENQKFFIPKMYDEYLTTIYGDYMTLPPVEKRHIHRIDARWKKN